MEVRDSRSKRVHAKIVRRNADSPCREACAQGAIASRHFILGPDIPNFLDDFGEIFPFQNLTHFESAENARKH
jgi:hypothetical protein